MSVMYHAHNTGSRQQERRTNATDPYAAVSYQNPQGPNRSLAGHKRKLEALRDSSSAVVASPSHLTAPVVPSFGPLISRPSQPIRGAEPARGVRLAAKSSLFGLDKHGEDITNDSDAEDDSDDDDEAGLDEEAAYAQLGTRLVFEYEGSVVKLDSEADLARWQEERKRRWPTQSRIDAKQDERTRTGAERKRLLEGAYALRQPGFKFRSAQERHDGRHSTRPPEAAELLPVKPKADDRAEQPAPVGLLGLAVYESDDSESVEDQHPGSAVEAAVNEDDGDEAPEQTTTRAGPEQDETGQRACKYFFHYGRCREGDKCAYRHEAQPNRPAPAIPAAQRRQQLVRSRKMQQSEGKKGIHQLLVDQEHEAADRLALQVIKYLGGIGFFDAA